MKTILPFTLLFLATLVTLTLAEEKSPIVGPEFSSNSSPKDIEAAKLQGAATAAKDIKAGVFRILYYGLPWSNGKPLVDDTTGYRIQIVGGCVVGSSFVAEADGYNETMRDWYTKTKKTEAIKKQ